MDWIQDDKLREDYFEHLCRCLYPCMDIPYQYAWYKKQSVYIQEWMISSWMNMTLFYLYYIAQDRFLTPDGNVYDMYLVKNSSEQERCKWVKFINGLNISEKTGPFKDYIEGKCEIDKVFAEITRDLQRQNDEIYASNEKKKNHELAKTYRDISSIIGMLKDYETYSDKKLDELNDELNIIIEKQDQNSMIGSFITFYCREIQKAYDARDVEKLEEIQKDWRQHHDFVWSRIPE